jgi:N-acetylmuramate 1-kinase
MTEMQKFLDSNLGTNIYELVPIKKGGSDRSFSRILLPDQSSFIFMHYGTDVEENAYWADINKFLAGLDISVPDIIARDLQLRFLLLEDLGDTDLWSQAALPWNKRREYYFGALAQIRRLHALELDQIPAGLKLTKGYGAPLYRWEHNYFLENFVGAVCQLQISPPLLRTLEQELDELIARLQKIKPCLIHRDFQSQNILLKNGRPVLIDFQGLRQGNFFYDLGSLLCDPYVDFTADERNDLIDFYYDLTKPAYSHDEFVDNFWQAAAQRLMQALGAYGYLGLKKNKPDFLRHIHRGLANLLTAVHQAPQLQRLRDLALSCQAVIDK